MSVCVGDVWRHPTIVPFGDHVVLRVDNDQVLLARPYASASQHSRQPWLSSEVYSLPLSRFTEDMRFGGWKLLAAGKVC